VLAHYLKDKIAMNSISYIDITSSQNQKLKDASKLRESKHRKKSGLFIVEGMREIERALESNFELTTVFIKEKSLDSTNLKFIETKAKENNLNTIFSLSEDVFSKIAVRESTENIICIFNSKSLSLADIDLDENRVVCVLDGLEKPGNLGAIFRSCDGAGVSTVIITNYNGDIFSPNAIRSSVGAIFSLDIVIASEIDTCNLFKEKDFEVFGAALTETSKSIYQEDFSSNEKGLAICLGTEADGLSAFWLKHSKQVIIPMRGISDSLNVSTAAAILLYEATRP
jgi:TrmH family RNA methyltransferase